MNPRNQARVLREALGDVRLSSSNGMAIAVVQGKSVQFPLEAAAQFFALACAELVPMLDELEELQRRQDPGLVDRLAGDLADVKLRLEAARGTHELALENNVRAATELARARIGVARAVDLSRRLAASEARVKTLTAELETERAKKSG